MVHVIADNHTESRFIIPLPSACLLWWQVDSQETMVKLNITGFIIFGFLCRTKKFFEFRRFHVDKWKRNDIINSIVNWEMRWEGSSGQLQLRYRESAVGASRSGVLTVSHPLADGWTKQVGSGFPDFGFHWKPRLFSLGAYGSDRYMGRVWQYTVSDRGLR